MQAFTPEMIFIWLYDAFMIILFIKNFKTLNKAEARVRLDYKLEPLYMVYAK